MANNFVARAALLLSTMLVALVAPAASAAPLVVDAVHSTVLFRIKHLNTSFSWGRFDDISGKVNLDDKSPSLEIQLKTDSIDTGNAKREEHLKSPDFFSAKQFPTISFRSTKITKSGDGKYTVDGTLKLHGVEQPISV